MQPSDEMVLAARKGYRPRNSLADALAAALAAMPDDLLRRLCAERGCVLVPRELLDELKSKRRYVAPVTECEACMTEDACRIRGQCAHYLRETDTAAGQGEG